MYATKYILPFSNDLNEFYEIYFDFLNFPGQNPILLTGTDDCLVLRSTSGDENKLEPILGTEALISIWVDETAPIDISDLIVAHDNDIRVTIYRERNYDLPVFQGFVVVEDNNQPFLDPPFALSVRATDGLGLLKGVDFGDLNGLRYVGNFSILSWLLQILYKTDQTLNLRVYFNFFESSFDQTVGALEQTFLDAITFSQGDAFNVAPTDPTVDILASSADDCYTALEKIVRCLRCKLFQEGGKWNLVSLQEYMNPAGFSYTEYSFGTITDGIVGFNAVEKGINKDYYAEVGKDRSIYQANDDALLYLKLATKWIKLTYTYDQAQNKVCNQDFSEGDRDAAFDEVISSSVIDASIKPVVNLTCQGFDLFCWDHLNGNVVAGSEINAYPSNAPTATAFIRNVTDELGFTIIRYAVMKSPGAGNVTFIRSNRLLIDTNDILQISLSWRTRTSMTPNTRYALAFVYLYGDDGTFWSLEGVGDGTLTGNPTIWFQTDSNFHHPLSAGGSGFLQTDLVTDTTQWTTISPNSNHQPNTPFAKAPVSGQVEILLIGGQNGTEYWYKDLAVTILPYLQGTYQQLKGDYNYSASNNNIKQTESDDIEISDSPKRYFKGALLHANRDLCTPTWARKGVSESFRFTQIMERIMYNHLYRMVNKIEGTFKGLIYVPEDDISVVRPNGFLNTYSFIDGSNKTKRFMLTSFEKHLGTGQWRGVFVETLQDANDSGFILPDNYQFNYLFQ